MKLFIVISCALVFTIACSARSGKTDVSKTSKYRSSDNNGSSNSNSSCLNDVYSCFEENELLFSLIDDETPFNWPNNDSALTELCNELQSTTSCLRDEVVKDCAEDDDSEDRNIAEQLVSAFEMYHDAVCPSPTSRSAFLRQTACYADAAVTSKVLEQLKIFSQLLTLSGDARCCSALYFKEAIGRINSQYCPSEVASYVNGLVEDVLRPNIGGCEVGRRSSSAACQDGLPDELKRQFASITAAQKQQSRQAQGLLGSSVAGLFGPGFSERDGRDNAGDGSVGWSFGEIFHLAKLVSMLQTQHPFIFHMLRAVWDYCISNDCLQ